MVGWMQISHGTIPCHAATCRRIKHGSGRRADGCPPFPDEGRDRGEGRRRRERGRWFCRSAASVNKGACGSWVNGRPSVYGTGRPCASIKPMTITVPDDGSRAVQPGNEVRFGAATASPYGRSCASFFSCCFCSSGACLVSTADASGGGARSCIAPAMEAWTWLRDARNRCKFSLSLAVPTAESSAAARSMSATMRAICCCDDCAPDPSMELERPLKTI